MERGISAAGSAQHWQCWGQGFESPMLHQQKKNICLPRQMFFFWMMFAFGKWCWLRQWWRLRLMICGFATFWGKHHIIAERSGATSFWAKRKTSYRRKAMLHLVWIYHLTRDSSAKQLKSSRICGIMEQRKAVEKCNTMNYPTKSFISS